MMRDTLKTIAGIIVIAAIVVATYLYGNHQHQDELRRQQAAKQQTQSPATPQATGTASANAGTNGTAPVASVQPNTIQGGKTATPTPAVSSSGVSLSQGSVGTPAGQGGGTLADTGSGLATAFELAAVVLSASWFIRSRRAVAVAVRIQR